MTTPISRVVIGFVLWSATGIAAAQEDLPWERYGINLGVFFADSDPELRFDSDRLGIGTTIDLENTLGMDTEDLSYRIDAFWRFGSTLRHQLEVRYFNVDNQGTRTLDLGSRIGDVLFPEGLTVNSQLEVEFINVDYSYAFFQDERIRLAGAIGAHTIGLDFNIDAPRRARTVSETFTAPLPVFGLRGDFIITPYWRFRASADFVYIPLDEYDIAVTDTLLALEYTPFEYAGIGLGLNNLRYKIASTAADVDGKARLEFLGALAYFNLRF
jgi:hypothetical protein